jgi:hypothetical protein
MNLGLIMIILNLNFAVQSHSSSIQFLFDGSYLDISSDWYLKIGSALVLTMMFNIFLPIFDLIVEEIWRFICMSKDKHCFTIKT